ncbi:MAG TPA: aspartyl protease family protein [Povalibacter sp.]|nr:aspartyl protease family protein [Povalibacter sp.]
MELAPLLLLLHCMDTMAASPAHVLALAREASGGERWDRIGQIEFRGAVEVAGLTGQADEIDSLADGRRVTHFDLKVASGANGFDGNAVWQASGAGLVDIDETPAGRRRAIAESFLSRRAWLDPRAVELKPTLRSEKDFDVVSFTPRGGDPVELWVDTHTHLLARAVLPVSRSEIRWSDYRRVEGLMLPHRIESVEADDNPSVLVVDSYTMSATPDAARLRKPDSHLSDTQVSGGSRTLPVHVENGHVYLEASINDAPPAVFILDTGAGANILTPEAARKFRVETQGSLNASGVGEEQVAAALATVSSVRVGPATLRDQGFAVLELPPLTAHREGREDPVAGLLGYDFLRRLRVTLDYDAASLTLEPLRTCGEQPQRSVRLFLDDQHIPRVPLSIDGVEALWSLDVGDAGSLTMSPAVAQMLRVPPDAGVSAVTGGGVGGLTHARLLRFDALQLGPFRLDAPVVAISRQNGGVFAEARFGGNLGYGILRNFTLTFDYECRVLELAPSHLYGTPAPYNGLGATWREADGAWRVVDAMPGSPAEAAGLRTGDELVSANDTSGTALTRAWLDNLQNQPPGTRVTLAWRRDREIHEASVALKDFVPRFQRPAASQPVTGR